MACGWNPDPQAAAFKLYKCTQSCATASRCAWWSRGVPWVVVAEIWPPDRSISTRLGAWGKLPGGRGREREDAVRISPRPRPRPRPRCKLVGMGRTWSLPLRPKLPEVKTGLFQRKSRAVFVQYPKGAGLPRSVFLRVTVLWDPEIQASRPPEPGQQGTSGTWLRQAAVIKTRTPNVCKSGGQWHSGVWQRPSQRAG